MAEYKIIFIGTVGSSAVNFRGSLLRRLVAKQCSVYVFLSNFASETASNLRIGALSFAFINCLVPGLIPFQNCLLFSLVRLIRD